MPNLTQERLADRDQSLRAFDAAAGRGSVIDRLRGSDVKQERLALEQDKFAYRQVMDAAEMQRKAAADAQRAESADQRLGIAEGRMTIAEKMAELATKNAEISERASQMRIDQELAKTRATERAISAGETYFKEASNIDPYAPDFDQKFNDLSRRTLAAQDNDRVKEHVGYLLKEREKANAYNMSFAPQAKPTKDAEMTETQRRLAHLESLRMKDGLSDPNVISYLDGEIKATKEQLKSEPASTQAAPAGPKTPAVGEVRSGYKFKGGDPADKANWEK